MFQFLAPLDVSRCHGLEFALVFGLSKKCLVVGVVERERALRNGKSMLEAKGQIQVTDFSSEARVDGLRDFLHFLRPASARDFFC